MDFVNLIIDEAKKIILAKGKQVTKVNEQSAFLTELQMDSLDLATLIVVLEEMTKRDPFRDGFKSFHTVGELAALYEHSHCSAP